MNLDVIQKKPKIGDYVFCSKWSDRSPSDPWCVGILEELMDSRGGRRYFKVAGRDRKYPNCQVINPVQGLLILGFYPQLECTDWRTWAERVDALGDEQVIGFFKWFLNPKSPTEGD